MRGFEWIGDAQGNGEMARWKGKVFRRWLRNDGLEVPWIPPSGRNDASGLGFTTKGRNGDCPLRPFYFLAPGFLAPLEMTRGLEFSA